MKEVIGKREKDCQSDISASSNENRSSLLHEKGGSNVKRRKLPMRVKLRQEAATQRKEEANNNKLSLIVKGMSILISS